MRIHLQIYKHTEQILSKYEFARTDSHETCAAVVCMSHEKEMPARTDSHMINETLFKQPFIGSDIFTDTERLRRVFWSMFGDECLLGTTSLLQYFNYLLAVCAGSKPAWAREYDKKYREFKDVIYAHLVRNTKYVSLVTREEHCPVGSDVEQVVRSSAWEHAGCIVRAGFLATQERLMFGEQHEGFYVPMMASLDSGMVPVSVRLSQNAFSVYAIGSQTS